LLAVLVLLLAYVPVHLHRSARKQGEEAGE